MNKWLFPAAVATLALLGGCVTEPRGAIPVVDSGTTVTNGERVSANRTGYRAPAARASQAQALQEESGVVVMVPGAAGGSEPLQGTAAPSSSTPIVPGPSNFTPITPGPPTQAPCR